MQATRSDPQTHPRQTPTRSGPVIIAYDGSPAAEHALREAGPLLAGRCALVLVVWKAGVAFELVELPAATIGLPPAPIDIRAALETDRALYEGAQRDDRAEALDLGDAAHELVERHAARDAAGACAPSESARRNAVLELPLGALGPSEPRRPEARERPAAVEQERRDPDRGPRPFVGREHAHDPDHPHPPRADHIRTH